MITKKQLQHIIRKINNRCNPHDYKSFDDLLGKIQETSSGIPSFFKPEEIEWVKSDPQIENNIMKMCQSIWDRQSETINYEETIGGILSQFNFACENSFEDKPVLRKNIQFLTSFLSTSAFNVYKDTIEEVLVRLDLSIIPYR